MKKYFCFILVLFVINPFNIKACTTFLLNANDDLVFGRNYDWSNDLGFVNTNLKGLFKTSYKVKDGKQISWTSKYGSITFNQYGKEFPTGGMNEKGLVVEVMWLPESVFAKKDKRAVLQDLQWIQYQLDNCSTIEEVIATDSFIRMSATSVPVHFLIADAQGKAATIEFLNGKMVTHASNKLSMPVLTNSTYESSVTSYTKNKANNNSLERFSTACSMINTYKTSKVKKPVIDYSFEILKKVAQENSTKWSIVYDIKNKKIYFKSNRFTSRKSLDFSRLQFACNTTPMSINLNQNLTGDIVAKLTTYSSKENEQLVRASIKATSAEIPVSDKDIEAYIKYPATVKCKD